VPKQVLTRRRSWTARIVVLAVAFSLIAVALPASAHSIAIDTTVSCPSTTPSAGFTDISAFGTDVQLAINCLAAFDITLGTTATTYSPNDVVLRWQMALFLVRQAAVHGIAVPAPLPQGYTDIATLPLATQDAINQVTQLGISKGTSTTTFSPNDGVTRWQMALFLRRLAGLVGITVTDDPAHNQFTDIGAYSAEIQAAINFLADAHIALGTGGSLFSGNEFVTRWQMALFLTRVLAADGIAQPQVLVTVTPTDDVTLATGNARAYTATFKNPDGTPYTGAVGLALFEEVGGVVQYDFVPPPTATFESVSDGLIITGTTAEGFPGTDGIVTFLVRDIADVTETIVPVAYEDINNDNDPEITGNNPPAEAYGVGGAVTFTAGPLAECIGGAFTDDVSAVDKPNDRFETLVGTCSINYDSNDILLIGGVATDLATFEAALNVGDTVTGTYEPATGDQSTIDISNDVDPALTITNPAAPVTVDALTYTITGTGIVGYTVRIYNDVDNDGVVDGPVAATTIVAADGTWSATVNLTQNAANNFLAAQRSTPTGTDGALVDVPTITEGASSAPTLLSTVGANVAPSAVGTLSPNDTITITFSEAVADTGANSLTVLDVDGTTATLTCGSNVTCVLSADGLTLTVTITNVLVTSGGTTGGINTQADITSITGYTAVDDGAAINVAGSGGGRTFTF